MGCEAAQRCGAISRCTGLRTAQRPGAPTPRTLPHTYWPPCLLPPRPPQTTSCNRTSPSWTGTTSGEQHAKQSVYVAHGFLQRLTHMLAPPPPVVSRQPRQGVRLRTHRHSPLIPNTHESVHAVLRCCPPPCPANAAHSVIIPEQHINDVEEILRGFTMEQKAAKMVGVGRAVGRAVSRPRSAWRHTGPPRGSPRHSLPVLLTSHSSRPNP